MEQTSSLRHFLSEQVDPVFEEYCFRTLRESYPQVNDQTHVVVVDRSRHEFRVPFPIEMPMNKRRTWLRLRGWKALYWRVVGELFQKSKWYKRGWELSDGFADYPPTQHMRLEKFGVRVGVSPYVLNDGAYYKQSWLNNHGNIDLDYYFMLAYFAATDTLFITKNLTRQ